MGITSLSGGDYDGDIVAFTTDPLVLRLMAIPLTLRNKDSCMSMCTELHQRLRDTERKGYYNYAPRVLTYTNNAFCLAFIEVRGAACSFYDVALGLYFASAPRDRSQWARLLVLMAEVTYAAYDAPKKYDADRVMVVARELLAEYHVHCKGDKSTTEMRFMLRPLHAYKANFTLEKIVEALSLGFFPCTWA